MRALIATSVASGILICVVASGCVRHADDEPSVSLELAVTPEPPSEGPANIAVSLKDTDGKPVTGATVKLEGNMSHAGMRPVFADAAEREPGSYRAPLEFTMGGDWIITVDATLPDGRKLQRQVDVRGVRSR